MISFMIIKGRLYMVANWLDCELYSTCNYTLLFLYELFSFLIWKYLSNLFPTWHVSLPLYNMSSRGHLLSMSISVYFG